MDHLFELGVDALYADVPDRLVGAVAAHTARGNPSDATP
jgi:hypothetical protein